MHRPVVVLTTSGTAVSELLPATIESHYQAQPLILLTADRPIVFRGRGAPQAIRQEALLQPYAFFPGDLGRVEDLTNALSWDGTRPLHLNVCLEEPAPMCQENAASLSVPEHPRFSPAQQVLSTEPISRFISQPEALLVLLGESDEGLDPALESFLQNLASPIWAEVSSGAHESEKLKTLLLRGGERSLTQLKPSPRKVMRIGGVPSCRFWRDLENYPEVQVLSISRNGLPGLARDCDFLAAPELKVPWPSISSARKPTASWLDGDRSWRDHLVRLLAKHPKSEPSLLRTLHQQVREHSTVFTGNSLPVREWNLVASLEKKSLRTFANRGANGIDGCLSTFAGLLHPDQENWGLFGDLTTLYDLSAPWAIRSHIANDTVVRIVVINNGGGQIFGLLPALEGIGEREMAAIQNPHPFTFEHWADMWQFDHFRATTPEDLAGLPSGDEVPRLVVELLPDPDQSEAFWSTYRTGPTDGGAS
ncbi:MAG: hypothetical protein AAF514_11040 [Verrucomicrobiota bacterium]